MNVQYVRVTGGVNWRVTYWVVSIAHKRNYQLIP